MGSKQAKQLFHHNILDALPPKLLTDYLQNGKFIEKTFQKNEIMHFEDEPCHQIELILQGEIAIERIGESGDFMTINRFGYGSIIGSNLIFSSSKNYPMTISSKTKSKVLIIPKDVLFELCNQYPAFLLQFIRIISDLSVLIGTKMKNRLNRTIRESIITYINRQYTLQQKDTLQLTMTKKALSEMFGISRTSLSRELQKMKDDGLIDYNAKTITIKDKALLH